MSGYYEDMHLYRAWRKYGIEPFEAGVVEVVDLPEGDKRNKKLDELEVKYIQQYDSYGTTGYNQTLGGDGGINGYEFTDLQKYRNRINSLVICLDGRNKIYFFDTLTKQYGEALSFNIVLDSLNRSKETRYRDKQICYYGRYIFSRSLEGIEKKKRVFYSKNYYYSLVDEIDYDTKNLQTLIDKKTAEYRNEIENFFKKYGKAKYNRKDNKTKKEALRKEQKTDLEAGITKDEYKEKYNVSTETFFEHVRKLYPEWCSKEDRILVNTENSAEYRLPEDNITEEMKKDLLDGMVLVIFQKKYNVSESTYYRYKFKIEKEFGVEIKSNIYKKPGEAINEEQEKDILNGITTVEYMKKYKVIDKTFYDHKKTVMAKHPECEFKKDHTYKPKIDIELIRDDILNGITKTDFSIKYNLSNTCYRKYKRIILNESKEIPSNITDEMRMDIENKMSRSDYMKKYNVSLSTYYNHKNAILK